MASDGAKLVARIEQRFGVAIPDDDVEQIETVGQLCDFLTERAWEFQQRPSSAAGVFYRMREVILDVAPTPRRRIRPRALLREVIPVAFRHRTWRALQEEFGHRLPDLEASARLRYGLLAAVLGLLAAMIGATVASRAYEYLFVLPFLWAIVAWLMMIVTRPFARQIPAATPTVAAAVARLIPFRGMPAGKSREEVEQWVFENVQQAIAQETGADVANVHRNSHFRDDLKLR